MRHLKKHTIDYLYLLILSIVTIYIWYPLTHLTLQWESYTYLIRERYLPLFTNTWHTLANFDVQAMLAGAILSNLFGTTMPLYFWAEIASILSINMLVYFLTKTLTKSSSTGFVASFIFSVYFFGIGFFLPNWYATFVQRVIFNVPLLLVSFIFLHRYLAEKKFNYYAISVSLFFLSILLAQFGIFLSISLLLYSIFWNITSSLSLRTLLRGFLISSPYAGIIIFFLIMQKLYGENVAGSLDENILYFFTHPDKYHYLEGAVRQLVYMSQYPSVVEALLLGLRPMAHSDPTSTYKFAFPILLTYIIGFIIIWIKEKKYRALLLTIVSSLIINLVVNIYLNRFDFLNAAGVNRYYYFPSIMLAIFWSLLLTVIFNKRRFIIIGGILFGFFLINAALFRHYFFDLNRYGLPTKKLYEYIMQNSSLLPRGTLVIVGPTPDFGPYDTAFFSDQLGIEFCTEDPAYLKCKTLEPTATNIVKWHYDKGCACVQKEILK